MSYRISAERVAHETVDGEVVILDRLNGSYFSLTGAGADAWALFAEPRTPELVADALARHYDADAATVRAAILALTDELVSEELLVAGDGNVPVPEGHGQGMLAPRPFTAPHLEKFTDLKDILLLDPIHDVDEAGWPKPAQNPAKNAT